MNGCMGQIPLICRWDRPIEWLYETDSPYLPVELIDPLNGLQDRILNSGCPESKFKANLTIPSYSKQKKRS